MTYGIVAAIVAVVLVAGCANEAKLTMKCKGDCTLDMGREIEIVQPEDILGLPDDAKNRVRNKIILERKDK